jgi:hypothetical protein
MGPISFSALGLAGGAKPDICPTPLYFPWIFRKKTFATRRKV